MKVNNERGWKHHIEMNSIYFHTKNTWNIQNLTVSKYKSTHWTQKSKCHIIIVRVLARHIESLMGTFYIRGGSQAAFLWKQCSTILLYKKIQVCSEGSSNRSPSREKNIWLFQFSLADSLFVLNCITPILLFIDHDVDFLPLKFRDCCSLVKVDGHFDSQYMRWDKFDQQIIPSQFPFSQFLISTICFWTGSWFV